MGIEVYAVNAFMPKINEAKSRAAGSINKTEHLVPHANRLLVGAARGAWVVTKFLVRVAIRIPGWFVRANRRNVEGRRTPADGALKKE